MPLQAHNKAKPLLIRSGFFIYIGIKRGFAVCESTSFPVSFPKKRNPHIALCLPYLFIINKDGPQKPGTQFSEG